MSNSNQINLNITDKDAFFASNIVKPIEVPIAQFTSTGIVAFVNATANFVVGENDIILFVNSAKKPFYIFKKGKGSYNLDNPIVEADLFYVDISGSEFTPELQTRLQELDTLFTGITQAIITSWNNKLDGNATAADSAKLGGELPANFAKATAVYDKAAVDNAITAAKNEVISQLLNNPDADINSISELNNLIQNNLIQLSTKLSFQDTQSLTAPQKEKLRSNAGLENVIEKNASGSDNNIITEKGNIIPLPTPTQAETTVSIQQKRPLKTLGGNSIEGTGDIPFAALKPYLKSIDTTLIGTNKTGAKLVVEGGNFDPETNFVFSTQDVIITNKDVLSDKLAELTINTNSTAGIVNLTANNYGKTSFPAPLQLDVKRAVVTTIVPEYSDWKGIVNRPYIRFSTGQFGSFNSGAVPKQGYFGKIPAGKNGYVQFQTRSTVLNFEASLCANDDNVILPTKRASIFYSQTSQSKISCDGQVHSISQPNIALWHKIERKDGVINFYLNNVLVFSKPTTEPLLLGDLYFKVSINVNGSNVDAIRMEWEDLV